MAETPDLVRVERREDGTALLWLQREPVNALSCRMWRKIAGAVEELEADPSVRGLVLCSALQRDVFCAGQDIREIYAPLTSWERTRELWMAMSGCLMRLFTSRLATVAAIKGACPAGGCLLCLVCDARVISETGTIGLNETAVGIPLPKVLAGLLERLVGAGTADRLAQLGAMLPAGEALRVGLVDEVAPSDCLMAAADAALARLLVPPDFARAETKRLLRGGLAQEWAAGCEADAAAMWARVSSPQVVAELGAVLERLSQHKAQRSRL